MATLLATFTGNQARPDSTDDFWAVIEYYYTEQSSSGYYIQKKYYVTVDSGKFSTWVSYCRASWRDEDDTFSLGKSGTYAEYTEDVGWVAYGTTLSDTAYAYYTGGSGTTYRSDVSTSYTVPAVTAKVTFYRNQSTSDTTTTSKTYTYGVSGQAFTNNGWSKTGHTMLGWSETRTATTATYTVNNAVANSWIYNCRAGINLYAIWKADTYTISYNANGGSGAPASQTKTYGVNLTLSSTVPTRTGYTFLGWSTSSTATSATYSAGGSYTSNSTTTLYAVWKINTWTISYDANGGSGAPSSQTKTYNVTLTLSNTKPTKTGHTFLGWSTSSTATSATYSSGGSYTSNSAATLYAVWKVNTYTVSFDANGGSGAPSAQTKTYGVALTLSSTKPTKSGYNFLGWSTSFDSTTAMYTAGGSYTENASITLYAVWGLNALVSLECNTPTITIASGDDGIAVLPSVNFSYTATNEGNSTYYYRYSAATRSGKKDSVKVSSISSALTATNGTITIPSDFILASMQNQTNPNIVNFILEVCTGTNTFASNITTTTTISVVLTNFKFISMDICKLHRESNGVVTAEILVDVAPSYNFNSSSNKQLALSIDDRIPIIVNENASSYSATANNNLYTFSMQFDTNLISNSEIHKLDFSYTDGITTAYSSAMVRVYGDEIIEIYKDGTIKATSFIQVSNNVTTHFAKGGQVYAKHFVEHDSATVEWDGATLYAYAFKER